MEPVAASPAGRPPRAGRAALAAAARLGAALGFAGLAAVALVASERLVRLDEGLARAADARRALAAEVLDLAAAARRPADGGFAGLARLRAALASRPPTHPPGLAAGLSASGPGPAGVPGAAGSPGPLGLAGALDRALALERSLGDLARDVEPARRALESVRAATARTVDALVAAQADAEQVSAAARALALLERIARALDEVSRAGDGWLVALDRAGRDAVVVGQVANALQIGSRALGVARVDAAEPRAELEVLGRAYRGLVASLEALIEHATAVPEPGAVREGLRRAALAARARAAELDARAAALAPLAGAAALAARVAGGGALLLAVAGVLGAALAARRAARREAEWHEALERTAKALEAMRRSLARARGDHERALADLAQAVWRVADGDLARPALPGDGPAGAVVHALDVLVERLDGGRERVREAASRLAGAVRLLADAAAGFEEGSAAAERGLAEAGDVERALAGVLAEVGEAIEALGATGRRQVEQARERARRVVEASGVVDGLARVAGDARRALGGAREALAGAGEVAGLAAEIADRSRLLALNLALHAARPGGPLAEQGADELGRLAERARTLARVAADLPDQAAGDLDDALREVKRLEWELERAGERVREARRASESHEGSADVRAAAAPLAGRCREQRAETQLQVRRLAALRGRAGETRAGAARVAAAAARLSSLAAELEQQAHGILAPAREPGARGAPGAVVAMTAPAPRLEDGGRPAGASAAGRGDARRGAPAGS